MTRLHPDDIQAIAERVVSLLGVKPATPAPQVSPADFAIQLAKAGKIEESKAYMRNLSKSTRGGKAHA